MVEGHAESSLVQAVGSEEAIHVEVSTVLPRMRTLYDVIAQRRFV